MEKAPDAFRTISEVAEVLETPAHVLRFWESRFPQIRPIKRAGGRRYYRPGDVALLAGIRHLLQEEGLTIRGVQKVLRESGVRHVQALSRGKLIGYGDITEASEIEAALNAEFLTDVEPERLTTPVTAEIVALPRPGRSPKAVGQMLSEAPPAANAPLFAETVPEAPFIEAEDDGDDQSDVHPFPAPAPGKRDLPPREPDLFDDFAALSAGDDAEEAGDFGDLVDLAALDGLDTVPAEPLDTPAPVPIESPKPAAPGVLVLAPEAKSPAADPAADPAAPLPIAARLRALPRPLSPGSEAALAVVLVRALALQARLADPAPSRG
jgi:DNA-binding transcriptional MerR regulator